MANVQQLSGSVEAEESGVLALIDKADERAIILELVGQPSDMYVYEFMIGKKKVRGISKSGAGMIVREMSRRGEFIRLMDNSHHETDDKEIVTIRAGRYVVLDSGREQLLDVQMGTADQPKMETVTVERGGREQKVTRVDVNAYRKAFGKAVRNSQLSCVPKTFQEWFIKSVLAGEIIDSPVPGLQEAKGRGPARQVQGDGPPWGDKPGDFINRATAAFGIKGPDVLTSLGINSTGEIQDPAAAWAKLEEQHGQQR